MTRIPTQRRGSRIPFMPHFVSKIVTGRKTCTARMRSYGRTGDVVDSDAGPLVLDSVTRVTLAEVADLWRQEGCNSRAHFISTWKTLHPRAGYQPGQKVYLHRFHTLASEASVGGP